MRADEVKCRVSQVTEKGCRLLLYKDARCDKRILDETFGIYGWKDRYEEIHGNLFCTISIWDTEHKQWIDKQDCGTESNTEKEKGEASDAFKRAAFNIGVGRELYTRIFIWLNVATEKDPYDKTGKRYRLKNRYEKWHVSEMDVDNEAEKITRLVISDSRGKPVYRYENGKGEYVGSKPSKSAGEQEVSIIPEDPDAPIICRKCRKPVTEVKGTDGKLISPEKVYEFTNGLCYACYREARKNV